MCVRERVCVCRCTFKRAHMSDIPGGEARQPTPVFVPGACHGLQSLAGYGHSVTSQKRLEQLGTHTASQTSLKGL